MRPLRGDTMFLKQEPQRGKTNPVDYRKIIAEHLPFVLADCAKYTASSRLAQIIAAYVFICAHRIVPFLSNPQFQMRYAIEMLLEIVGRDLSDGTGTEIIYVTASDTEKIVEIVMKYLAKQKIIIKPVDNTNIEGNINQYY
jgi:hypothetical protein